MFSVKGSGCRVSDIGCRVQGAGSNAHGLTIEGEVVWRTPTAHADRLWRRRKRAFHGRPLGTHSAPPGAVADTRTGSQGSQEFRAEGLSFRVQGLGGSTKGLGLRV